MCVHTNNFGWKSTLHSMAMVILNKSKETTPNDYHSIKGSTLEDHFPQELKSLLSDLTS